MTRADWTYDCALDDVMNENGDINYQRLCKVYHSGMESLESDHEAAIAELTARLAEAQKVIEFYADKNNYTVLYDYKGLHKFTVIGENELQDNGNLARAYQKESAK